MLFGDADEDVMRGASLARGDPVGPKPTFAEAWRAVDAENFNSIKLNDELLASWAALEQAYDKNIDEIFAATGERHVNPTRAYYVPDGPDPVPALDLDAPARFDAWRHKLAEQRPDLRHIIRPDGSIEVDAQRLARDASGRAQAAWDRAEDLGSLRYVPFVMAHLKAAATDPVNYFTLPFGPWGRVGRGAAQIAWYALKAGAANATVEAGVQPFVQKWRAEAGLPSGLDQALPAIAGAGLFGFLADAGVRTAYRGVQRGLGREAVLDEAGGVTGYRPRPSEDPEAALDLAAQARPADDVLRRAAGGDLDALRAAANDAGVDQSPEFRGAMAAAERERMFAAPDGIPEAEHNARMMSLLADDGLPPGDAIVRRQDLVPAAEPVLHASPLEFARALRGGVDLSAGQLPLHEGRMRTASALARLSDDAFAMVERGDVSPEVAVLVGDRIPDAGQHAPLLAGLARDGITREGEAREHIAYALARPAPRPSQPTHTRLDDPTGAEAAAQAQLLERELGDAVEAATRTDRPDRSAFSDEFVGARRHAKLADIVEFCRT